MAERPRHLHWRLTVVVVLLWATTGVAVMGFARHWGTAVIVFGGDAVVWGVFALFGLTGSSRSSRPSTGPDLPRRQLTWRTFVICLAVYDLIGVGSLIGACLRLPSDPVLAGVLVLNAGVVAAVTVYLHRRVRLRRQGDVII